MPAGGVKQKKEGHVGSVLALLFAILLLAALAAAFLYWKPFQQEDAPIPTPSASQEAAPSPTPTPTPAPDLDPPVIEGPQNITVAVGMTPSYRSGVTAVDEVDGPVRLEIDASAVNLTQAGEYPVIYSARDQSGNRAETAVTVTVVEVSGVNDDDPTADVSGQAPVPEPPIPEVTQEMVDQEADRILAGILSPSMTQWDKARAIYNYVHTHVKYVGYADKSSWLIGAYVGFVRGRGDCYNYFACSKALLTRAGIPNVDLYRVGGSTDHYWQLVDVGSGWYHFDACPHPDSYPLHSFLLDEPAVRAYTEKCARIRTNYYVYDYANCPVVPVGFPIEELPAVTEEPLPEETEPGTEAPLPTEPLETDPEEVLLPPGVLEQTTPVQPSPEPAPAVDPVEAPAIEPSPDPEAQPGPIPDQPIPESPLPPEAELPPVEPDTLGKEEMP